MIRHLLAAAVLLVAAPLAAAATCSVEIESNDAMKYNLANIDISKSCKDFTINLKHVGKLPKAAMGHNVVIAATADMAAVASDGIKAGAAAEYIKADDARVIAHSKMIGGGESTSMTFPVAKLAAGPYSFFCSFPGHSALMKGTITLTP
ncbi:MAG TPA: azurin [Dokdonella sp.]|nr:azurin [Dokdonella sp.]MBX3693178.1 azurin [Dokdonella sp.]MCW5568834.1 azurin [Dokdonella sp.]HNR92559.1 azurin [Dokdonella sp.]